MIERTLLLMKPDAVQRAIVGKILERFENVGLKIVGMKMVHADRKLAEKHYLVDNLLKTTVHNTRAAYAKKGIELKESDLEIAKRIQKMLTDFLVEGPVIALVLEGPHAIEVVRKLVGGTEPRTAAPGTIRGDFFMDSYFVSDKKGRPLRNLIHASGIKEEAEYEIALWFMKEELFTWESMHDRHVK